MIHGLGVDITDIARVVQAQTRNDHFAVKVLTPAELAQFQAYAGQRAWEYLAGRFSAKEAYSKAYGTGIGTVAGRILRLLITTTGGPA